MAGFVGLEARLEVIASLTGFTVDKVINAPWNRTVLGASM